MGDGLSPSDCLVEQPAPSSADGIHGADGLRARCQGAVTGNTMSSAVLARRPNLLLRSRSGRLDSLTAKEATLYNYLNSSS